MSRRRDITGEQFGKLTAIKDVGKDKHGQRMWHCYCDCGNTTITLVSNLVCGLTKSCGCLVRLPEGEAAFNRLYNTYKGNANNRGLAFDLSKDEFRELTSSNCDYCGTEPEKERKTACSNGAYVYNGIDRVDNSVGYVRENCVPCCWKCNQWKGDRTKEEFLDWVARIYETMIAGV